MNRKHIIWSNEINLADWQEWLYEEYPDITNDADRYRVVSEELDSQLDDVISDLNIEIGTNILCIADCGLWDGRKPGYKFLRSTNISSCFRATLGDYATFYLDDRGDLCCDDTHHDGTNYMTFRAWKPGISEDRKRHFLSKVVFGHATRRDITSYTVSLGPYIADIYGWTIRRQKAV